MKKFTALILIFVIVTSLVTSCNILEKYKVEVTGSEGLLITPILPFYKAGEVVEIKTSVIHDAGIYIYVNDEKIPMTHFDSDYWGFEFVMPAENVTVHITMDRFYGKDNYTFDELSWWNVDFENEINKVAIKTTQYSDRNSFVETRYSFEEEDIENFKAIVDQQLTIVKDEEVTKAYFGYEFIFYSSDGRFDSLRFNDENFWWNDFSSVQLFRFSDPDYNLPRIENPDLLTYSFRYDGLSSDLRRSDGSFLAKYFEIDCVEFIPITGEDIDAEAKFYLDSRYGKINLLTPTVFELNGVYYEIVSGGDYWAYTYLKVENK